MALQKKPQAFFNKYKLEMCALRAATATRLKISLRAPERIDYVPFRAAFKDFVPILAPELQSTPDRRTSGPERLMALQLWCSTIMTSDK